MKLNVEYNKAVDISLTWHEYLALCTLLRNAPDDGQWAKMRVRTQIVSAMVKFEDQMPAEGFAI